MQVLEHGEWVGKMLPTELRVACLLSWLGAELFSTLSKTVSKLFVVAWNGGVPLGLAYPNDPPEERIAKANK